MRKKQYSMANVLSAENEIDETIVYHILNERNVYIDKEYVDYVLRKYGVDYRIKELHNFRIAMVHISYMKVDLEAIDKKRYSFLKDKEVRPIDKEKLNKVIPLQDTSYERIEFLGDSIIRAVFSEYFYDRYVGEDEGFLTKLRTKVEKGESLARFCRVIGLQKYMILSKYIEEKGGRELNAKIQEDVFESFIGALHLDGGYDICRKFLISLVEKEVDLSDLLYKEDNYKDILLQLFHKKKWGDPKYAIVPDSNNSADARREFMMSVSDENGKILGVGAGSSKRKGEQEAARIALDSMNFFEDSESESEYEEMYGSIDNIDELDYIDTDSE